MSEQVSEIEITAGLEAGTYRISTQYSKDSVSTTAQGMLDIADWVEQRRDQLRKEVGQEFTHYRVVLIKSSVVRADRPNTNTVEMPIDATNAQEAASRALLQRGARQMKFVIVMSAPKEETFYNVTLQPDHSITFETYSDDLRPQPPLVPPFDPDKSRDFNSYKQPTD